MRPIFAVVIACLIILFVHQYTQFAARIRPRPLQYAAQRATGEHDVRVICTFDVAGNAFGNPALRIKFRDKVLFEENDRIAAGQVVEVKDVEDIKVGLNELFVEVNPEDTSQTSTDSRFSLDLPASADSQPGHSIARAVHVEIRRDGVIIAQQNIWSSAPGAFGELVQIEVSGVADDHDH